MRSLKQSSKKFIKMKTQLLSLAALVFFSIAVSAQETKPTVKEEVKKDAKAVGTAVEKGADWTADTAKKGVKATEKGIKKSTKWTKKTAKKGKKAVKEGYEDTKEYVKKETK